MFTYGPLLELLKKKGLSFKELCDELGMNETRFRVRLNTGGYISIEELDGICRVLKCQPSEVLSWGDGEQKRKRKYHVDWSKVTGINQLSIKIGMSSGALTMCKSRDGTLDEGTIARMAKELGLKKEDLIKDGIGDDFPTFDDVVEPVGKKMSDPDVDKTLEALGLSKGVKKGLGGPASPSKK